MRENTRVGKYGACDFFIAEKRLQRPGWGCCFYTAYKMIANRS